MTGFGQGVAEGPSFRLTVTLRGVNHRFLDVSLRLRDEMRPDERQVRDLVASRVQRGRVEGTCEVENLSQRQVALKFDDGLVSQLAELAAELRSRQLIESGLSFTDLMRVPDAIRFESSQEEWSDEDRALLLAATEGALDQLLAARDLEGAKLQQILLTRIDALEGLTAEMSQLAALLPVKLKEGLEARIQQLLEGDQVEPDRLAQEVAVYVDKSDVSEEVDRLLTHLQHFRTVCGEQGSLGKRLDFLTQEIFRELNTVGSKCRDSELTRLVLDGKVLCEQLREQVQNVE